MAVTRHLDAAYPRLERSGPDLAAYLALLRLGVAVPPTVASGAVGSYPTISPLPAVSCGRYAFCCPVRRLAAPRRYLAACPVELGLSSAHLAADRDRLTPPFT